MPGGLELARRRRGSSAQVVGGAVMPALAKSVLVVPEADHADVERHAVDLAVDRVRLHGGRAAACRSTAATSAVMSLTSPASTCCLSTPPPQDWKRSGGSPAWVTVVSLALNASFSSGCDLDLDVRVRGLVLLGHRRPDRQHRLGVLDVPPVDGLGGGLSGVAPALARRSPPGAAQAAASSATLRRPNEITMIPSFRWRCPRCSGSPHRRRSASRPSGRCGAGV